MARIPHTTLEQWQTLQAIVDHGGFAQAAEALNKSQSAVSYAVRKLQEQLPLPVFVLEGRKARLTPAGEVLLRRARGLLDEALALERLADTLAQGWEPEIRLAVDIIFPPDRLLSALDRFTRDCRREARETRITLLETVLSGTDEALFGGAVDLVLSPRVPPGFLGTPLLTVEFVAVAHPEHPLHQLGRTLSYRDLQSQRQLVIRDSCIRRSQDSGWLGAEQRWTVSHIQTSIHALKRGLGFAWIPREHIQDELQTGVLKPLPLQEGATRQAVVNLIFADYDNTGPATRRLAQLLQEHAD